MKMNLDRLLSWTLLLSSLCLCASRLPRGTFDDTVVNRTNSHANLLTLAQEFELAAKLEKEPSDKVTHHGYQEMYGTFLLPMLHHRARRVRNRPFKMLEIGLGCDMKYGAGKSISIWKRLLEPEDILWAAELDKKCVSEHEKELRWLQGVLTGDQADETTLLEWVTQTRSGTLPFDVIIDDGGHENHQIYASFKVLFEKSLAPGGIYFIEDLHVNRLPDWADATGRGIVMIDVIKEWQEQLITREHTGGKVWKHRIPKGIKWIVCFPHACAIAKCDANKKHTEGEIGFSAHEFLDPLCS